MPSNRAEHRLLGAVASEDHHAHPGCGLEVWQIGTSGDQSCGELPTLLSAAEAFLHISQAHREVGDHPGLSQLGVTC